MFKKFIPAVAILLSPFFCIAQSEDSIMIKKIADEVLTNGRAYENLRFLCKKSAHDYQARPRRKKP